MFVTTKNALTLVRAPFIIYIYLRVSIYAALALDLVTFLNLGLFHNCAHFLTANTTTISPSASMITDNIPLSGLYPADAEFQ